LELWQRYFHVFDHKFHHWLQNHLNIKYPKHKPDELYTLEQVQGVARHILSGTATSLGDTGGRKNTGSSAPLIRGEQVAQSPGPQDVTPIKKEELDIDHIMQQVSLLLGKTFETAVANTFNQLPQQYQLLQPVAAVPISSAIPLALYTPAIGNTQYQQQCPWPGDDGHCCSMCHNTSHFLGQCDVVQHYIVVGKIMRDGRNNIVLNHGERIPLDP